MPFVVKNASKSCARASGGMLLSKCPDSRIWLSVFWCALLLFWIPASWTFHGRHPWQPFIWILLPLVQLGTLWTYWDIDSIELVAHSFGVKRSFQLSAIDQVGPPAQHRRLLAKTVQIDYRGRQSLFVTVADRETFQETLRIAVLRCESQRPGGGILGLDSRSQ